MLSLSNTFDKNELLEFDKRVKKALVPVVTAELVKMLLKTSEP
jgi:NAD-dependent DNA ligase